MARAERAIARPILLVVGLGTFLAQLDGTVMNVVLSTIGRTFHAGNLGEVQAVITAYLVTSVALLPMLGALGDRHGRKRLFLAGFAVFGAASLLCTLAPTLGILIALRVLQAVGGALLSGASLAIVAGNSGEGKRGESLGRLAIVFALAGLLGPPLGGGLAQAFGWRSVFLINVPLALAGIWLGARLLPPDRISHRQDRPDWTGAGLFAASTALIVAGIGSVAAGGLHTAGVFIAWPLLVALSLAGYLALLRWESRAARVGVEPLLNLSLLSMPAYGLGLILAFLSNGITIGLFVLVPFWLTKAWHVGAAVQGVIFLPVALGLGGLAPLAGRRADRIGTRALTAAGMLCGAIAAAILATQTSALIWPALLGAMLLLGASGGLFAAPNNSAILAAAPETALGVASSMLSAARTLGVIAGVSAAGSAFDALRGSSDPHAAGRILFLAAALLYLLNAALCWSVRGEASGSARAVQADHTARGAGRGQNRTAMAPPDADRQARRAR